MTFQSRLPRRKIKNLFTSGHPGPWSKMRERMRQSAQDEGCLTCDHEDWRKCLHHDTAVPFTRCSWHRERTWREKEQKPDDHYENSSIIFNDLHKVLNEIQNWIDSEYLLRTIYEGELQSVLEELLMDLDEYGVCSDVESERNFCKSLIKTRLVDIRRKHEGRA